jgi:MFS family permease
MSKPKFAETDRYGWIVVAVAFFLSVISFGTLSSVGIFLKPLIAEFGWTRGNLSLGYTAVTFAAAFAGILWGIVVDRHGSRWVVLLGALILGIPLLLMAQMEVISEFYLYYFLFGAFGHAAITGPLYACVGLWFTENVGLALGITFAGSAVGQGILPYIARHLIDNFGWQTSYTILGVAYILLAIPAAVLVRDPPNRKDILSNTLSNQTNSAQFPLTPVAVVIWISIAVIFCCISMSVVVVHLIPLLTDHNISSEDAVTVFLTLMIAGACGRILAGKLTDHIGALPSYALMSLLQTSVVFIFPYVQNLFLIYLISVIFGMAFSGVMASFLISARRMVPPHVLARSMAIVGSAGWVGMGLGGWQGGILHDLTGSYHWSFANGSIAGLINLLILFLFYKHIRQRSPNHNFYAGINNQ